MKYFRLASFLLLAFLISSCEKEIPQSKPKPVPFWRAVQGKYKVTDLDSHEEYEMEIRIKTDTNWLSATQMEVRDTIFYFNFNNQFAVIPTRFQNCMSHDSLHCLTIESPFGILDKNNYRWMVTDWSDDLSTSVLENTWYNGEITFYYRINNTAFWVEDGNDYLDVYKKQKAIKIGD